LLPHVLIYGHEFPQSASAGGILLNRLFADYPGGNVAIFGPPKLLQSEVLRFRHIPASMPWSKFESSRFNVMHRSLRAHGLVPLMNPAFVEDSLGDFRPDVVLTVMQHGTWYESAMRYAKANGIPLVAVIHDDNEGFDKVYSWARAAQRRRDGAFYRFASGRLCVSAEMEHVFAARYGARGCVMPPNRSEQLQPREINMNRRLKTDGRFTLGFVGNPNYGYGEQMVRMLPVLRSAGCRLIAYGQTPGGAASPLKAASDVVELRGFARTPEIAWEGIKADCDALLFPYLDPPGEMGRMYAIHFPSKLPEYLAAGMPIVMVGPDSATGVGWAKRNPEAVLRLRASERGRWADELHRLACDGERRAQMAEAATKAGARDFDPVGIRRMFVSALCEAAAVRTKST